MEFLASNEINYIVLMARLALSVDSVSLKTSKYPKMKTRETMIPIRRKHVDVTQTQTFQTKETKGFKDFFLFKSSRVPL